MSNLQKSVIELSTAWSKAASPYVDRNRELFANHLKFADSMTDRELFLAKADKDNLGNGIGTLTPQQLEAFVERFPAIDPSTDLHVIDYPKFVSEVVSFWTENEMASSAVILLQVSISLRDQ